MTWIKKNRALLTGLVSVGLVVFFVTSVLVSGQSMNLSKSDQSLAAGGTLGNVKARCLDPGTIELTFDPHTGADHYAIEGFKEYSGAGPRVFGFVATKANTYIAHDPDFIGNKITMDVYAQTANAQNIAGPAFAPQVTCPSSPTTHASITRVTCDAPGKLNLAWQAHTGADHYAIEVFSKGIGGAGGGSRVAGFFATSDTNYIVNDPDLVGGTFTADIYAQDAMNQNIYGPVFADTVTCPGTAGSGAWKINMQAVCPNGNIPTAMQGTVGARWRPYPYQPNGQLVGYENGGAMSATGLVTIDAPIINQDLFWFSYMAYRYPNNTFVQTLKSYGSMPNSHFEAHDYTPDNLRYQVTWDEQTPAGTYNLKFTLPTDAPECASTTPPATGAWKINMQAVCPNGGIPTAMQGSVNARWRPYPYQPNGQLVGYENGGAMSSTGLVQIDAPVINKDLFWFSYLSYKYPNNTFVQTLKSYGSMPNSHFEAHDYTGDNLRYQVTWDEQTPVGTYNLKFTLPADAPECASTTPPVACSNKDLMMVLDTSGSMSGQRIRDAQAAIQALVAKLPSAAGARAGVVGFGSHAYSVADMTETMSKVSGSVGKLKATGGTNLAEGITLGTSKLAADNRTHIMLILTDGLANLPRAKDVGPNDPAAYATAQAAASIAVQENLAKGLKTVFYSVGLGKKDNLNSVWLDTLTSGTGGRSAYTSKSGDLDNLFASLTNDICKEAPSNAGTNLFNKLQGIAPPRQ